MNMARIKRNPKKVALAQAIIDAYDPKLSNLVKHIITPFNFHIIRHTCITITTINNIDLETSHDLMRHSNINTTTSVYTHIQEKHK